ncbi:MAG: hypothetical protein ACKVHH_03065 [Candidatus Poseidoniales archaeon]
MRTADFRLAYRLCDELRRRDIKFVVLGEGERLPNVTSVWMGTPEEVAIAREGKGIGVNTEAVELGVERALQFSMGLGRMRHLSFGIDPGPRPGLAWLADGVLIGTSQLERIDDVADHIKALTKALVHDILSVMIGDGVPTMRNRIINCCLALELPIHLVDERRTSHGVRRHHHHSAAIKIAQMKGKEITERMPVLPTEGELREVQHRSRKTSQGRLTISSELAKAVVVGRLTMHEAIENQRLKNHKN